MISWFRFNFSISFTTRIDLGVDRGIDIAADLTNNDPILINDDIIIIFFFKGERSYCLFMFLNLYRVYQTFSNDLFLALFVRILDTPANG